MPGGCEAAVGIGPHVRLGSRDRGLKLIVNPAVEAGKPLELADRRFRGTKRRLSEESNRLGPGDLTVGGRRRRATFEQVDEQGAGKANKHSGDRFDDGARLNGFGHLRQVDGRSPGRSISRVRAEADLIPVAEPKLGPGPARLKLELPATIRRPDLNIKGERVF